MSVLTTSNGMATSSQVSPSTGTFRRNASTPSVASVNQSFLDPKLTSEDLASNTQDISVNLATTIDIINTTTAGTGSPLPIPPPIPQQRALHGRTLSNTRQSFFEDNDNDVTGSLYDSTRARFPNAPTAPTGVDAIAEKVDARKCDAAALPTPKLPANGPESYTSFGDYYNNCGKVKLEASKRENAIRGGSGISAAPWSSDPLRGFPRQYENSRNPYLRAAAKGISASANELPLNMSNFTISGVEGDVAAMPAYLGRANNSVVTTHTSWYTQAFSTAAHTAPQLSQPLCGSAPHAKTPVFGEFASFTRRRQGVLPAVRGPSASTALRGIPLFTHKRQKARLAASSSQSPLPLSLRQSLAEYEQLQLQDEAVYWYHRSSELEHQLSQLQAAYDSQSKLLTAQWSRTDQKLSNGDRCDTATTRASHAGFSSETRRNTDTGNTEGQPPTRGTSLASHSIEDPAMTAVVAGGAAGPVESSFDGRAAIRSLSPNSLSRTYGNNEVGVVDGARAISPDDGRQADMLAEGSASVPRTTEGEAILEEVTEYAMRYIVPRPHVEGSDQAGLTHGGSAQDTASLTSSVIRRGPAEVYKVKVTTDAAAEEPAPTRNAVAVQTEPATVSSSSIAFEREVNDEATVTATRRLGTDTDVFLTRPEVISVVPVSSSPPPPSAILAKQYAEAVGEMEAMRVRLDIAERESESWREMCVAQDLRCDELETQLLAKEEQLMRYTQQQVEQQEQLQQRVSQEQASEAKEKGKVNESESTETSATNAARSAVPAVELKPFIAQLSELLSNFQRILDDEDANLEVTVKTKTATTSDAEGTLQIDGKVTSVCESSPLSVPEENSSDDTKHLNLLLRHLSEALPRFAQHHAALRAELEVVRADRNELIGEQSEQVRLLQQQLLDRDTVHLQLMERLHDAEQFAAAISAERAAATSALMVADQPIDSPQMDRDIAVTQSSALEPQESSSESKSCAVEEVVALKTQLTEAKVAAAAAQGAQHNVLKDRVKQLQAELRETRLQAEDEYDRLSSTIEDLRRELADAKEALRVKEMSLRIALRESAAPARLMAALRPYTGDAAVQTQFAAALATGSASGAGSDDLQSTPPGVPRVLFDRSRETVAAAVTLPQMSPEALPWERTISASPSPPISSPTSPSPTCQHPVDAFQKRNYSEGVNDQGNVWLRHTPASPLPQRGKMFVDDGTLRTLPSSVPLQVRDENKGVSTVAQLGAVRVASLSSSREKSSRGLTTSADGRSHTTASTSLPRSRGGTEDDGIDNVSSTAESTMEQIHNNILLSSQGEKSMDAPLTESAPFGLRALPLRISVNPLAAVAAELAKPTAMRKNVSARKTDVLEEVEDESSLLAPLHGPLFRNVLSAPSFFTTVSTTSTATSVSLRPVQDQLAPLQLPAMAVETVSESIAASSSSLSPFRSELHPRRASCPLATSAPLSPEKRLQSFFKSSSGSVEPDAGTNTSAASAISSSWTNARIPTAKGRPAQVSLADERPVDKTERGYIQGGVTPARTPVSLLSERTPPLRAFTSSVGSTPSSGFGGSPHVSEVAARHTQASLHRHREVWQQQESLLQSLLSSPSP